MPWDRLYFQAWCFLWRVAGDGLECMDCWVTIVCDLLVRMPFRLCSLFLNVFVCVGVFPAKYYSYKVHPENAAATSKRGPTGKLQPNMHARIWDDRWRGMIARFILDTNVHLPRLCVLHDLCRFVLDWCRVVVNRCISLWLRTLTVCLNFKIQQQSLRNWYVNHDCQFLLSPYNIVHQTFVAISGRSNRSMATWPSCLRVYVCKWCLNVRGGSDGGLSFACFDCRVTVGRNICQMIHLCRTITLTCQWKFWRSVLQVPNLFGGFYCLHSQYKCGCRCSKLVWCMEPTTSWKWTTTNART